jgi:hypothetical protein
VGVTIGCFVLTPMLRRLSTLFIDGDGLTLLQFRKTVYVSWSNVDSIRESTFGASLVFKEPQPIGIRQRRRFLFAGLDLFWTTRPTSAAVLRQVARFQRGDTRQLS